MSQTTLRSEFEAFHRHHINLTLLREEQIRTINEIV